MSNDGNKKTDRMELPEHSIDELEPFELPELELYFEQAAYPNVQIIHLTAEIEQGQQIGTTLNESGGQDDKDLMRELEYGQENLPTNPRVEQDRLEWIGSELERQAVAEKLKDMILWGTAGEPELTSELKSCEETASQGRYGKALVDFKELKLKVEPLHVIEDKKASDKRNWDNAERDRTDVKQKLKELKVWSVSAESGYSFELQAAETKASQGEYEKALLDFNQLKQKVDQLYLDESKKAADKTAYYKQLKKQHARIQNVDNAVKSNAYGKPLVDPVKTKVEAYTDAKGKVVQGQNSGDFTEAKAKLGELVTAIQQLEAARLQVLEKELNGADTCYKVKDVVKKLQPNEIAALPPAQQCELLKTLRTTAPPFICSECKEPWTGNFPFCANMKCKGKGKGKKVKGGVEGNRDLFLARCKIYDNMSMQPEFVEKDKEMREQILTVFETDIQFENAKKEWSGWDVEKRLEFLRYAAKRQCDVMGQGEPEICEMKSAPPRRCAKIYFVCQTPGCNSKGTNCDDEMCKKCNKRNKRLPYCGADWTGSSSKGKCEKCGGIDTGIIVTFGGCDPSLIKGGTKSKITLNPNAIGDFDETFNTIMHENAHNYQFHMIKLYREYQQAKEKPEKKPYPEEYELQIMMWDENARGYVEPPSGTYDKQPVELHAWKFGNKMAAKKLHPKPKLAQGEKPQGVEDLK